jgi:hypothetical protein
MRWIWILVWTYLIFVLHTGVGRLMAVAGGAPHLALAGMVLMTLRISGREGLVLAAGWGFISDCLTEGRLGPDVMTFVLAGSVIRKLSCRWNLNSPGIAGAASGAIVWGALVIAAGLRIFPDGKLPDLWVPVWHAAGSGIFTGVLVAVVTPAVRYIVPTPAGIGPAPGPDMANKWRMLTE